MVKQFSVATVMLVQSVVEPLSGQEESITRYAMTQGGLLVVVLVLLWFIRNESLRKDERLQVMTEMVATTTAALTKSEGTTDRLARAVENLERRRGAH